MLETDSRFQPFAGVRFALFGFHSVDEQKVRSKLVKGGGVDVGQYSTICTHIIVDKHVYEDPVCVAARRDGKTLVTGLWVDHSCDIGMPVDATSVMYRPSKNLNGIPGANNLIICLTGYQRQDRDDIMTMVRLMGAQFSKPLVANKVTHLICYKFEGEKYELAKKMKKIKLVNHKWLEDCLMAWDLLPEGNYSKSGYELEVEGEAKDSEEETEDALTKQSRGGITNFSPGSFRLGMQKSHEWNTADHIPDLDNVNTKNLKVFDGQNTAAPRDIPFGKSSSGYDRAPDRAKMENEGERYGDADVEKESAKSYSRKNSKRYSLHDEAPRDGSSFLQAHLGQIKGSSGTESSPFRDANTPLRGTGLLDKKEMSGQKRKIDASCAGSELQMAGQNFKPRISENPSATDRINEMEVRNNFCISNTGFPHDEPTGVKSMQNSPVGMLGIRSNFDKPFPPVSSKSAHNSNDIEKAYQTPVKNSKELNSSSNLDDAEIRMGPYSDEVGKSGKFQGRQPDDKDTSLRAERSWKDRSPGLGKVENGENDNYIVNPLKKKSVPKKSLGSRPKLRTSNLISQKGSISFDKTASPNVAANILTGEEETESNGKFSNVTRSEAAPAMNNMGQVVETKSKVDSTSAVDVENKIGSMDDETEPPEDRDGNEYQKVVGEKSELVKSISKQDLEKEEKSGGNNVGINAEDRADMEEDEQPKQENKSHREESEPGISASKTKAKNGLANKRKKRPFLEAKTVLASTNNIDSTKDAEKEKTQNQRTFVKEKIAQQNTSDSHNTVPPKKLSSMEVEKESVPTTNGKKNMANKIIHASRGFRKALKSDPVWFILSGHRLQRKEFQKVIRTLKGRCCRDSHHWSYQATHFIVPDPIRRTEKFFAAAASGRWIMKTDYLTASSQAGKFVAEEPYEWHKNGLSEDGTLNLEAPRKWRLLRERTGHGALYGMHIVIYGECIAPPLDALKRVVKAGDGTILATSPPYTRFLGSSIDYAIVSPGMPRVDVWVQEFLRHEIPCVLADYLVEYVCKPGYSLEKHVLYHTHAWAEKSFARLLSMSEEIAEDLVSPPDHCTGGGVNDDDDLVCEVCGSSERGEVMLICGDEAGTSGCGVGTHIECCDPPLEGVPEDDWFCPKCRKRNSSGKPLRKSKKAASSKRR